MGPGFGRRDRYIHGLLDKIVSSGIISVLAAHKIFPSLLPRASTARDHWSKQFFSTTIPIAVTLN